MLNKVILIGNVGKDPIFKDLGENKIFKCSIATGDKNKTAWHRVTAFGKLAETCSAYLTTGRKVYVEGSLQYSTFEKDGIKHTSTEIIANNVIFLTSSQDFKKSDEKPSTLPKYPSVDDLPDFPDVPF